MRTLMSLVAAVVQHRDYPSQTNLDALIRAADQLDLSELEQIVGLLTEAARMLRPIAPDLARRIDECLSGMCDEAGW